MSGDRVGDAGYNPTAGLPVEVVAWDVPGVLPFVSALSPSCFFPSFQKSLFRGLVEPSPVTGSSPCRLLCDKDGSLRRGEAESLDSVLGAALFLSLGVNSLGDILTTLFGRYEEEKFGSQGSGCREPVSGKCARSQWEIARELINDGDAGHSCLFAKGGEKECVKLLGCRRFRKRRQRHHMRC